MQKKTNFKSVYIAEPSKRVDSAVNTIVDVDSLFGFDNSNTIKLYNAIKGDKTQNAVLFENGDLAKFAYMDQPALILIDDEVSADAFSYSKLSNKYDDSVKGLNDKTTEELKSMLTKDEVSLAKSHSELKNPKNYDKELIGLIKRKAQNAIRSEEDGLYNSLRQTAQIVKAEDVKKIQAGVLNFFEHLAQKV